MAVINDIRDEYVKRHGFVRSINSVTGEQLYIVHITDDYGLNFLGGEERILLRVHEADISRVKNLLDGVLGYSEGSSYGGVYEYGDGSHYILLHPYKGYYNYYTDTSLRVLEDSYYRDYDNHLFLCGGGFFLKYLEGLGYVLDDSVRF